MIRIMALSIVKFLIMCNVSIAQTQTYLDFLRTETSISDTNFRSLGATPICWVYPVNMTIEEHLLLSYPLSIFENTNLLTDNFYLTPDADAAKIVVKLSGLICEMDFPKVALDDADYLLTHFSNEIERFDFAYEEGLNIIHEGIKIASVPQGLTLKTVERSEHPNTVEMDFEGGPSGFIPVEVILIIGEIPDNRENQMDLLESAGKYFRLQEAVGEASWRSFVRQMTDVGHDDSGIDFYQLNVTNGEAEIVLLTASFNTETGHASVISFPHLMLDLNPRSYHLILRAIAGLNP